MCGIHLDRKLVAINHSFSRPKTDSQYVANTSTTRFSSFFFFSPRRGGINSRNSYWWWELDRVSSLLQSVSEVVMWNGRWCIILLQSIGLTTCACRMRGLSVFHAIRRDLSANAARGLCSQSRCGGTFFSPGPFLRLHTALCRWYTISLV